MVNLGLPRGYLKRRAWVRNHAQARTILQLTLSIGRCCDCGRHDALSPVAGIASVHLPMKASIRSWPWCVGRMKEYISEHSARSPLLVPPWRPGYLRGRSTLPYPNFSGPRLSTHCAFFRVIFCGYTSDICSSRAPPLVPGLCNGNTLVLGLGVFVRTYEP